MSIFTTIPDRNKTLILELEKAFINSNEVLHSHKFKGLPKDK